MLLAPSRAKMVTDENVMIDDDNEHGDTDECEDDVFGFGLAVFDAILVCASLAPQPSRHVAASLRPCEEVVLRSAGSASEPICFAQPCEDDLLTSTLRINTCQLQVP